MPGSPNSSCPGGVVGGEVASAQSRLASVLTHAAACMQPLVCTSTRTALLLFLCCGPTCAVCQSQGEDGAQHQQRSCCHCSGHGGSTTTPCAYTHVVTTAAVPQAVSTAGVRVCTRCLPVAAPAYVLRWHCNNLLTSCSTGITANPPGTTFRDKHTAVQSLLRRKLCADVIASTNRGWTRAAEYSCQRICSCCTVVCAEGILDALIGISCNCHPSTAL